MIPKRFSNALPALFKPFRVLWNQMFALFFLVLGGLMVPYIWQAWKDLEANQPAGGRLVISALFCGFMLFFGFSSYWKARKIERS